MLGDRKITLSESDMSTGRWSGKKDFHRSSLVPRLLPQLLVAYTLHKMGREPGISHHMHIDVLCMCGFMCGFGNQVSVTSLSIRS